MDKAKKSCFVIMPFRDTNGGEDSKVKWNKAYEFIKRCIESASDGKYKVSRSEATTGNITKGIIKNLKEADIVVADCTDRNANVFYELGVRHSVSFGTILVAQNEDSFPFDIVVLGRHIYNLEKEQDFIEKLKILLYHVEMNLNKPDSDVGDYLMSEGYRFHNNHIKIEIPLNKISFGLNYDVGKYVGYFSFKIHVVNLGSVTNTLRTFSLLIGEKSLTNNDVKLFFPESQKEVDSRNEEKLTITVEAGRTEEVYITFYYNNLQNPPDPTRVFIFESEDIHKKAYRLRMSVTNTQIDPNNRSTQYSVQVENIT